MPYVLGEKKKIVKMFIMFNLAYDVMSAGAFISASLVLPLEFTDYSV